MPNQAVVPSSSAGVGVLSAAHRRVSWGAVLAGVAVALSIQLLLNLLGLGIGASTIDIRQGNAPGSGLAIGAGIWFAVSTLLSLLAGGWAAGRLAGVADRRDGMLHGFTTWSITSIVTIYLLSSAAGSLIGGSFALLGKAGSASSAGVSALAPSVTGLISQTTGVTPADVKQQAGDVASDPRFQTFVTQLVGQNNVTPEARQSLVDLIAQKQRITPEQANSEVSTWQQKLEQAKEQAKATAAIAADNAAAGLSKTALWSFAALLLGAIAASFGGLLGSSGVRTPLLPFEQTRYSRPAEEEVVADEQISLSRSKR